MRTAIVTGGASGIGRACVERLRHEGLTVVVVDRAVEAADQADSFRVDLADDAAIVDFASTFRARYGRLDVLVNNAGVHPKKDGAKILIEETTTAMWNAVIAVNLTAPFVLFRELLPLLRRAGDARVINVASRGGRTVSPIAAAHYSASKAGLIGLTRVMAIEGAADGVMVNCVAPGPVLTSLSTNLGAVRDAMAKTIPVGRYGRPEEIAAAVAFLASPDASFITGAVIDANGGSFMP
ncbi:SDR family NAD(P)-dependent oxidoreductase [Acuticoccus mangrovi]|uniref:SDR family oxidoreductase n=1 Tax=Acuticoccus mangrovi TaxID=2796142 RepID=A0A934IMH6_9HYPH|nr:SDR family NAD(P)-dependent oxidoreductase [Acuticoccus mangrovi]MBJ3775340.1 SDR family oxidoreductase [Acuticoccus mangrovi]